MGKQLKYLAVCTDENIDNEPHVLHLELFQHSEIFSDCPTFSPEATYLIIEVTDPKYFVNAVLKRTRIVVKLLSV